MISNLIINSLYERTIYKSWCFPAGSGRQHEQQEDEADDESHFISISFLLLKTGSYNSTNIIEVSNIIIKMYNKQKICHII